MDIENSIRASVTYVLHRLWYIVGIVLLQGCRKQGRLREGRRLGRKIRAAVKADRRERARRAGEKLMLYLGKAEISEVWGGASGDGTRR